ncbi:MAG: indolepyruvate ferredoxin oxidoreductase subunit beta [Methanocellales archaeon]
MSFNLVIAGVGGQGAILLSDIIGSAAVKAGKTVIGAETHGMAQRGGSVEIHLRIDCKYGSLVPLRSARVLLGLEPLEALRYARYLSKDGIAIVNMAKIPPPVVILCKAVYPADNEIIAGLKKFCREVITLDALELAKRAGSPLVVNIVMLGALSKFLPLSEELLRESIAEHVPAKIVEVNKRAFELGRKAVQ